MADSSIQIWIAGFSTLTAIAGGWLSLQQSKLQSNQRDTNRVLEEIRKITMGRELSLLKLTYESLQRLYEKTGDDADKAAAQVARQAFLDRAHWSLENLPGLTDSIDHLGTAGGGPAGGGTGIRPG